MRNIKHFKKLVCMLLVICTIGNMTSTKIFAGSNDAWKNEYKKIIKDWKRAEKYVDMSYLSMYFGKDYKFDKYFLYDVDKNKVPELFLYSTSMSGMITIITYDKAKNKAVGITYNNFYKIDKSKKTIVLKGHWHGAGGSQSYEYAIYKLNGSKIQMLYYIDKYPKIGMYKVYNKEWKLIGSTKSKYNSIYNAYVKGGKKISSITKYKLTNKKPIDSYK